MVRTRRGNRKIPEDDPLESLKRERDHAIQHAEELQKELRSIEAAHRDVERTLDDCRENEGRLQAKMDTLRDANQRLDQARVEASTNHRKAVEQLAKTRDNLKAELKLTEERSAELNTIKANFCSLKKAWDEKNRELGHLQAAHQDMQSLLDTRTRELRDTQAYLTKTDSISHADVHRMVEKLNSLIFQLSAQIADDVTFATTRSYGDALRIAYINITNYIGEPIAALLFTTPHDEDCAWVQLGLQGIFAFFSSWLITAWDLRFDGVKNGLLTDIHQELFTTESQTVSARWRGLVRRSVRRLGNGSDVTLRLIDQIMSTLVDALCISGVMCAPGCMDRYRDKVRDLVSQSLQIQRAIGEEVCSSDFQIVCPPFNKQFCAESMEDVDDCGRGKNRMVDEDRMVLCCTELGLRRCENVADRNEDGGGIVTVTLIKAKVALRDDGSMGRGA